MEIPAKPLEVHLEDRHLISQLATLQDMHNQVRLRPTSICPYQKMDF
jgi:hypothetical protein